MSEETTKGLVLKKLIGLGYPKTQDTKENGIIIYKEDSYKNYDDNITNLFSRASKSLSKENDGRPDFTIVCEDYNLIIVVECKEKVEDHQFVDNLQDYKSGIGNKKEIQKYAINGALHYASFGNVDNDVLALAVSGIKEDNIRITSFICPKGSSELKDIELIEDGDYQETLMTISDYKKSIDFKLGRNKEQSKKILDNLSKYAVACAKYLRDNEISTKDRAGFISAVVLALTNEDSNLYKSTRISIDSMKNGKFEDLLGNDSRDLLKKSLNDIWENKDKIPEIKRKSLEEYYNRVLTKALLNSPDGQNKDYFKYGENILSCLIYSVYENIILVLKDYTDLDIMGTFYMVFLKYARGDAKEKGIVLTPKHITELFCDIAEHYIGHKLDNTIKVLDTCCGTGGFLIAALNRMDRNINNLTISEKEKQLKKADIREKCLIGVESEPEMFALCYANMRFHGDGKSNLYSCSSLLKDKEQKGIAGKDNKGNDISLEKELKNKGDIDIGLINPPFSLSNASNNKNSGDKQKGKRELDFVYSMLSYLKKGGIGIAIVPISCASDKGIGMREVILKEHTLLACMSMPHKLFYPLSTMTCIMVFKAHIPHNESDKAVFLSRWLDDGFSIVPHNGRFDKDNKWITIKEGWLKQLKGRAEPNDTIFIKKEIEIKEECLAEAYIETDYSKLSDFDFEKQLKKYALFMYMSENDLLEE